MELLKSWNTQAYQLSKQRKADDYAEQALHAARHLIGICDIASWNYEMKENIEIIFTLVSYRIHYKMILISFSKYKYTPAYTRI